MGAQAHRALVEAAREKGLKVHLDGARLWHAAEATGDTLADLAWGVDTVNVCLSKGLGAPMGSVLAGSARLMTEARRLRKMLGGGVRQGGVLGAAGLVALDQRADVPTDHARARALAQGLRDLGLAVPDPDTNILLVPVTDAPKAVQELEARGIRTLAVGSALRFITHRDLEEADVPEALARLAEWVPLGP
jgi:threonine aldolase